ncbi:MAG: hypothetical protein HY593_05040 [Candidatus Omnitrophica bacterium]|nr:hypothetical protein [Candidatus Omnitrophota bacterium]
MKKAIGVFVFMAFMFQGLAVVEAAERGTEEYNRLVEYKKIQREKRMNPSPSPEGKAKGFWQKEAERSGFAGTAAMFGNAITGAIPLDKPNSRKQAK